ncbi:MAG: addiction module protein [Deltaproteobacteria bacterium]|nr:addiction module protein [Deltaproteobacteria bacterium]
MTAKVGHLLDTLSSLPLEERAAAVAVLTDSLQHNPSEETDAAWIEESKRRLAGVRRGESTPVPTEVVEQELDEIVVRSFETNCTAG